MARLRVGIVGCGAIGSYVAKAIDEGVVDADLVVVDTDVERASRLVRELVRFRPKVT